MVQRAAHLRLEAVESLGSAGGSPEAGGGRCQGGATDGVLRDWLVSHRGETFLLETDTLASFRLTPEQAREVRAAPPELCPPRPSQPLDPARAEALTSGRLHEQAHRDGQLTSAVVYVAGTCNLRCGYCWNSQGGIYGTSALMDAETADRVLDFLLDPGPPTLRLTLMGGEPLMAFPAVERLVQGARQRLGERASFVLNTNGTLLTPSRARFLAEQEVEVSVSVDGPPSVQDRQRPQPGGRRSSPAVRRGLDAAHAQGLGVQLGAVVTTETATDLVEVVDAMDAWVPGARCVLSTAEAAIEPGSGRATPPVHGAAFQRYLDSLLDLWVARWLRHGRVPPIEDPRVRNVLVALYRREPVAGPVCPLPEARSLTISPDGRLFPCHEHIDHETSIGHVVSGFRAPARALWWDPAEAAACRSCPVRGL